MLKKWFYTSSGRSERGLDIVRITIAFILIVHPVSRIFKGVVGGFGGFLTSENFPAGVALAWLVTLTQFSCSLALLLRRLVPIACIGHISILIVGIALIHAKAGWFVVGGGTNGMEFSITLIGCLLGILYSCWPAKITAL